MRHGDKVNNLGRKKGHRDALLKNLSAAVITHKRITTTLAKAKALRVYLEPIITKAKSNTTHARRVAFSYLNDKEAAKELFGVIAPKVADRPGGYLRVIKLGTRKGDGAEMAMIELVDFNELLLGAKAEGGAKKKRTRRSSAPATAKDAPAQVTEEATDESTEA
jgi:large subunit ribosomal protein L17